MSKLYKVIDENGVVVGGKNYKKGAQLPPAKTTTAQIRAFLRFKQIEETQVKTAPKKEDPKK